MSRAFVDTSVVTTDKATGQPVVYADFDIRRVQPHNEACGATNAPDGFASFWCAEDADGIPPAILRIKKAGYQSIERPIAIYPGMGMIRVEMASSGAEKPTKAQVLNVRASFCSHKDSAGNVVFDPGWIGLVLQNRHSIAQDWIDTKKRMGVTHFVMSPKLVYPNYIVSGQDVSYDVADDPFSYAEFCADMLDHGMIPVVYLTNGDPEDMARVYDGRFKTMCQAFVMAGIAPYCVFVSGWENFGRNPSWTTKAICDALGQMVDVCGPDVMIAQHINSEKPGRITWASYPVQPDDPTQGNEIGAHYMASGEFVSLYFYQTCFDAESPVFALPEWYAADPNGHETPANRWAECLWRFVPEGTYIPAYDRMTDGPWWFAAPRPVGPEQMVLWEPGVPYNYIRGWCSDAQVKAVSDFAKACRVLEGCYVP